MKEISEVRKNPESKAFQSANTERNRNAKLDDLDKSVTREADAEKRNARSEVDDVAKRNKYKEEKFGNRKTVDDEYTGKRIKRENVNIDHVTPIDTINKAYPDLKPEQRKELANNEKNLAVTNEKLNKSKGNLSNSEVIDRNLKRGDNVSVEQAGRMLDKQIESEKYIKREAKKMKIQNNIEDTKKKFQNLFNSDK